MRRDDSTGLVYPEASIDAEEITALGVPVLLSARNLKTIWPVAATAANLGALRFRTTFH